MAGKLRRLTSDEEIIAVYNQCKQNKKESAALISDILGETVSPQIFSYWLSNIEKAEERVGDEFAPKVLVFDIETSPIVAYAWGLFKQNIPIDAIINDWKVLCWSAKWLGSQDIISTSLPQNDGDEKEVVRMLWELLDQADYVVAHNGKKFDVKKMNSKFLEYELGMPSHFVTIDTLQIVKGNLNLTSNKLDWVATFLGIENKHETSFALWKGCMEGSLESWEKMVKYCDQDVNILEQVYLKVMHLDKRSPNYYTYFDGEEPICKVCGEEVVETSSHKTAASTFPVYSCVSCGHNQRSRKSIKDKTEIRMVSM